MPKLAIDLDDHWTQTRRTRLDVNGPYVGGCGLSLDVFRHLFDFDDGTWFACVHGGYADNLTLASLSTELSLEAPPFALSAEQIEGGNVAPLSTSLGFRALTPAVLRAVGAPRPDALTAGGAVLATLDLHDNFLFGLSRKGPRLARDVVRLVLRVHQHYLGIELDAEREVAVAGDLVAILEREKSIELQSEPDEHRIRIGYTRPLRARWLDRVLKRTERVEEIVRLGDGERTVPG